MPLSLPNLLPSLKAIGKGYVFVGHPRGENASGLVPLGATEGEIKVAFNQEFIDLKFPEYTGPAIHARELSGENVVVTIPMILGDPDLYKRLSSVGTGATGVPGGGYTSHRPVTEFSLVVIPEAELRGGALSIANGDWTPAAPKNAVWFWRGHFNRPGITYRQADGGKVISEVTFQAMFDASIGVEGHHVYTIGDPLDAGITDLVI
jgi:hypothetical protein